MSTTCGRDLAHHGSLLAGELKLARSVGSPKEDGCAFFEVPVLESPGHPATAMGDVPRCFSVRLRVDVPVTDGRKG